MSVAILAQAGPISIYDEGGARLADERNEEDVPVVGSRCHTDLTLACDRSAVMSCDLHRKPSGPSSLKLDSKNLESKIVTEPKSGLRREAEFFG